MEKEALTQWVAQEEAVLQALYVQLHSEVAKLQIEEAFLKRKAQALVEVMIPVRGRETVEALVQQLEEAHDPDFQTQSPATKLEEHFGSQDTEAFAFHM